MHRDTDRNGRTQTLLDARTASHEAQRSLLAMSAALHSCCLLMHKTDLSPLEKKKLKIYIKHMLIHSNDSVYAHKLGKTLPDYRTQVSSVLCTWLRSATDGCLECFELSLKAVIRTDVWTQYLDILQRIDVAHSLREHQIPVHKSVTKVNIRV